MRIKNRANPAGGLGIAGDALSYADKKERDNGITLSLIDQEEAQALFGALRKVENYQKRFSSIRKWQSLRCKGGCHD